ncbi:MAG: alpha-L-fucosidase [Cyclobacteriaceae bacterium]|nr:alpha-L-fucosidase [Cyclobacteriaceae bacterium]
MWHVYSLGLVFYTRWCLERKKIHEMRPPHVAEWMMYAAEIPREEYAQLAPMFNPVEFNADEIAQLAKDAGMKYLVITSKHHDGFALFDSKVSEYDVMDATPFKRDIIKELYHACKDKGLEFGLYYSHNIDWMDGADAQSEISAQRDPDISDFERTFGANLWDPSPNSFEEYLRQKAVPQVQELLHQLPDLKLLWYDMHYRMTAEQSFEFYKTAYNLQPQVLINERIGHGYGDFTIPGDNTIPKEYEHLTKPWETVGTFNNSWGYNSYDNDWKSPVEVLYWLVEIVSKGGNYMLNIGPTSEGIVPEQSVNSLKAIGKWLSVNGEAIYGTHRWEISKEGPTKIGFQSTEDRAEKGFENVFTPQDFWFTMKDNNIYAISLVKPEAEITVRSFPSSKIQIDHVEIIGFGTVKFSQTPDGLTVIRPVDFNADNGFVLKIVKKEPS